MKPRPLLLVGWSSVCYGLVWVELGVGPTLFPVYRASAAYEGRQHGSQKMMKDIHCMQTDYPAFN